VVVLAVLGALVYLWGYMRTTAQLNELEALRTERRELLQRQDRLRAEIAGLQRSSRIRKIAAERLGMGFPAEPPKNLYLRPVSPVLGANAD